MSEAGSLRVRVQGIRRYKGKRGTTYSVRWTVDGKGWQETFATLKLADGFRAELLSAARNGNPFNVTTGRPPSQRPEGSKTSWFDHSVAFVDMKWPDSAPKYRQSLAGSLAAVTLTLLAKEDPPHPLAELRRYLYRHAYNLQYGAAEVPDELSSVATWLARNTVPVERLNNLEVLRATLRSLATNIDGSTASPATFTRRRSALHNCLEYAVERELLRSNPLVSIKRKRTPVASSIDRRRVANPTQAQKLLRAVADDDPELHPFFAVLYYAGTRPGEALNLRPRDCHLPDHGWGQLLLSSSYQRTGSPWTDDGARGGQRQLKHRASDDTRPVPAHPALVKILREHIESHEIRSDRRIFARRRGTPSAADEPLSLSTVRRAWQRARAAALSSDEYEGQLAQRPYDLRHACLSTWLNAGVAPVQVAEWAGHSVEVLLRVYAKCIDGDEQRALAQIENATSPEQDRNMPKTSPRIPHEPS